MTETYGRAFVARIPEPQYAAIFKLAVAERRSFSAMVRILLDRGLSNIEARNRAAIHRTAKMAVEGHPLAQHLLGDKDALDRSERRGRR